MSTHREEHNTKKQSQLINEINYSKIVFTVPTQITIFTSQITIFTYQKSKDAEHYKLNTGAKRSAKGPKFMRPALTREHAARTSRGATDQHQNSKKKSDKLLSGLAAPDWLLL